MHISDLTPDPGERYLVFGTSRAGKSALMDWHMRDVQEQRPDALTVLVDSKPRFRAEQEVGPFGIRRSAEKRYASWAKGPVVPNSVVMDLGSDKPFAGMWKNPGEIVIMQSGEMSDWKRMLSLLGGFVNAHIKGRERLMIIDECLDFTVGTRGELIPRTTCFTELAVRAVREQLEPGSAHIAFTGYLHSSSTWHREYRFSTSAMIGTCDTYRQPESRTPNHLAETTFSDNGAKSREEQYLNL